MPIFGKVAEGADGPERMAPVLGRQFMVDRMGKIVSVAHLVADQIESHDHALLVRTCASLVAGGITDSDEWVGKLIE